MSSFIEQFLLLAKEEQIALVNELLVSHASIHYNLVLPTNYLQLSLRAMKHLGSVGRCNILFDLAKGLGTMHQNVLDFIVSHNKDANGFIALYGLFL